MIENINNKKFSLIKIKYGDFYKISYHDFYEYILNKTKIRTNSFFFVIKNLILIIFSFFSIIKIFFFTKDRKANYFIIKRNKKNFIDKRSQFHVKKNNIKHNINFVRSENFLESVIVFFSYPNIIFIYSFKYFINFFLRIRKKDNFYEKVHKQNYLFYLTLKKIFLILKINEIHLIDDYRIAPIILSICSVLRLRSIGYMHGRISKYNMLHKYFSFSKFYLWSNFYRRKLENINKDYLNNSEIIINRYIKFSPRLLKLKKNNFLFTEINLLYVIDANINDGLLINNFKKISKYKSINLFIKFRPNDQPSKAIINFCLKNRIKFYHKENVYRIFLDKNINFLMSTYSTLLIEASLMSIYPLIFVINKRDNLVKELISDKAVIPIYNFNDFYRKLSFLRKDKKILKKIHTNVWK